MIYVSALLHFFFHPKMKILVLLDLWFEKYIIFILALEITIPFFGKFLRFALDDSFENCAFIDHELAIKSNFDGILCFAVRQQSYFLLLLFCCLFLARLKSSCDEGLVNDIFSKKCINCAHKYHICFH